MTTKAYSYTRFSTPEQAEGDSARRQIEAARKFAEDHGLELDEARMFADEGVSAFRGKNAETGGLKKFREAVEDGYIVPGSWLIVENLDRISRESAYKVIGLIGELIDAGITVATTSDEQVYDRRRLSEDNMSIFYLVMGAMRANDESRVKQRRLRAVWTNKRDRASEKPLTKISPAWLEMRPDRSGWLVDEAKATVVRRIFEKASRGIGLATIAAHLNEDDTPQFGRGQRWHKSYVFKIVTNPAVIGTFVPHTLEVDESGRKRRVPQEPVPGYFPPVVDEELWHAVGALRRTEGRRASSPEAAVKNPFAGISRCGKCGAAMTRINKGGGYETLVCTAQRSKAGCDAPYIRMESAWAIFEGTFMDSIEALSDDPLVHRLRTLEEHIEITGDRAKELAEEIWKRPSPTLRDQLDLQEKALDEMKAERDRLQASLGAARFTRRDEIAGRLEGAVADRDFPAVNEALKQLRVSLVWEGETRGIPAVEVEQG